MNKTREDILWMHFAGLIFACCGDILRRNRAFMLLA